MQTYEDVLSEELADRIDEQAKKEIDEMLADDPDDEERVREVNKIIADFRERRRSRMSMSEKICEDLVDHLSSNHAGQKLRPKLKSKIRAQTHQELAWFDDVWEEKTLFDEDYWVEESFGMITDRRSKVRQDLPVNRGDFRESLWRNEAWRGGVYCRVVYSEEEEKIFKLELEFEHITEDDLPGEDDPLFPEVNKETSTDSEEHQEQ